MELAATLVMVEMVVIIRIVMVRTVPEVVEVVAARRVGPLTLQLVLVLVYMGKEQMVLEDHIIPLTQELQEVAVVKMLKVMDEVVYMAAAVVVEMVEVFQNLVV